MTDFKECLKQPKKLTLEDRLYLVKRKLDKVTHITVDQDEFRKDPNPPQRSRVMEASVSPKHLRSWPPM